MDIWVKNVIDKTFYAPFVVNRDMEYYNELSKLYKQFYHKAQIAGAPSDSLHIIEKYESKIKESIRNYYHGNIISFHQKILNLVKECLGDSYAVR